MGFAFAGNTGTGQIVHSVASASLSMLRQIDTTSSVTVHDVASLYGRVGKQLLTDLYKKKSSESIYFIKTPWGTFETWQDAAKAAKTEYENGNQNVITDVGTIKRYCEGVTLSETGRRTKKEWRGKNTHDLGFGLELKDVRKK